MTQENFVDNGKEARAEADAAALEIREAKTQPGGRCTRCGRALKRSFMVNNVPYGPVCVKKIFGVNVLVVGPARAAKIIADTTQQPIFDEPSSAVAYHGDIIGDDLDRVIHVIRNGQAYMLSLEESLRHVNHSPTGFCWGYGGSGPAQAAFAILYDYLNHDLERVRSLYQDFKFKVIAGFPMDKPFTLTEHQIESALTSIDVARLR